MKSSPEITALSAHAVFPLSLLEAMRSLDRPVEDGIDAANHETKARRLGLSSTVASQIERYRGLAKSEAALPAEEVASVFRLVGRRSDAELVLADAGRRAARHAARSAGLTFRVLRRSAPRGLRSWLGVRDAVRLSRRVFGARLAMGAGGPEAEMEARFSPVLSLGEGACAFHGAALHELLRFLTGFEGALVHESCCGRGDEVCRWRSLAAEEHT
ncbi:MAG: hypothetical protein HKM89_08475 [Gemmatimonadales bacterium]|nr:hypothetical protein [Gemmatimonadales bacterium]